ncbi:hypothetical protein HWQ46_14230 [Shewanella sp. D64]|uniref:hypothetical protein n=1 Tax=unclassified Shewanella TaxID=196818 RepID=UPI0022BA4686|nr:MULTISPECIES: hypothetical protein [unclassified Shewanella]MEC4726707.1 hypothetical protein [Shewanella sp. D64]MEC4738929.1 hypothetical protein [Shewanella sp. E94]WBJ96918.1 hypothetical protein HWQ47_07335 [Shewanella sp. MTB7]
MFNKLFFILTLFGISSQLFADNQLSGNKHIYLIDIKGHELLIGDVLLSTEADKTYYQIHIDHSVFKDYFLSMKEMKCLEGPELWCHLPYPYPNPREISQTDQAWLAHDLLFMYKKKADFGANFYNGIYYQLSLNNGVISGTAQAVDLNLLASAPDDLDSPPITDVELDEIEENLRWLPKLEIK